MAKILAATFDQKGRADATLRALEAAAVPQDCITVFHNNAPGQHGEFPVGGDENADPAASGAEKRTLTGAAAGAGIGAGVGGIAAGPLGAAAGAGVGALAGALAGTYAGLAGKANKNAPEKILRRPAGTVVAVKQDGLQMGTAQLIQTLCFGGAVFVEEAEGEWRDGKWADFDPLAEPRVVAPAPRPAHRSRPPV